MVASEGIDKGPLALRGGQVLTPDGWRSTDLVVESGRIARVGPADDVMRVLDVQGLLLAPGFVDTQINGGHGFDLVSDPAGIWPLAALLPRHGTTAFLPTIVSSAPAAVEAALGVLAQRPTGFVGAEPAGLHLEGPMLNVERRGAHQARHLREPAATPTQAWSAAAGVALVTLAPELPGAAEMVAELVGRGVTVSAGHTEATAPELDTARRAGLSLVTHLFNAMAPMGHRHPGVIGSALADHRLIAGLIVDGIHVDPTVVRAAWNAKGPGSIALVTDAVAPMGMGPGRFELDGRNLVVSAGAVRNAEGRLAGSALSMDQAVRNLVAFTGCPPDEALRAASTVPAAAVGLENKGCLVDGADADIVVVNAALEVVLTVCRGEVAYLDEQAEITVGS
ncbi:MAG: N-acetylglucosamine-6-phosphate deacetylase [Actinomycetia bacterium]|nr:N-acetylglucosamine-6-phosphate deacetylase [Actinomycetes bacterium]